ncbi:MAG TPA: M1 family metallopeptidase [Chitinophagaceae bacterium]|nr:M1 family metallopeptidase [Chitinophagaceae bacterium]
MKKVFYCLLLLLGISSVSSAQEKKFTHTDTLRGTVTPERAWWDVMRYDIWVKPDYDSKTIVASNIITFKTIKSGQKTMQIDLQPPLVIDSMVMDGKSVGFEKKDTNVWYATVNAVEKNKTYSLKIYYHGSPRIAVRPPWDGGWQFTKDSLGRPWMTVTCQGLGASVWYPCKDYQGDEPDNGASLSMTVPDTLVAVANGRMVSKTGNNDGTTTWKWQVVNPINNYNIIPYIGKYVGWKDVYKGEKGDLDCFFWSLDYDEPRAKVQFQQAFKMLKAFEYWYGPYPFYEDGYKLIEAPHLGMEHQTAVAYGNHFLNGYLGRDLSRTGWGLKWDFIIVHESGHEWFANNITSKDLADMWIHEGITNFSETLFTDYWFGKEAGNEYNYGTRKNIRNDRPIIAHYGVNEEGSGDMYYKGGNMMQLIRHSIDDDSLFRQILRGLNRDFYHQTVTTQQVEGYISKHAGIDFSKIFDQYLRTTQIPVLEYYFSADKKKITYRWTNCVKGFDLQLALHDGSNNYRLKATENWKTTDVADASVLPTLIDKNYYVKLGEVQPSK